MIYIITNKINGKRYVGKAKDVQRRWYQHTKNAEYGKRTHLYDAIRKYGASNFNVDVLDSEYSNECECKWIARLAPEYNMTIGGDGGWIHDQTGNRWKVRDSSRMGYAMRGKAMDSDRRHKTAGANNYQSKYLIDTPWGTYPTWRDAATAARNERMRGNFMVVTDIATLRKYCENDITLSVEGRRTCPEWRGRSTRALGFNKRNKDHE